MFNKITIGTFVIAGILYFILIYAHADTRVADFVGGILIGILIGFVGALISKLLGKKKTSPEK
ncbi:MAG: hypothetical protein FWF53_01020 [Candidatus Azobacteroides sp.]|nr:hypothetical protein [Candidatus Azobacteroides sp.]